VFFTRLNNFVNFDFFLMKLLGIDPCGKRINICTRLACLATLFYDSKLEAMAIHVVNQACGNDIRAGLYVQK
jgi:hypothetical protein